MEKRQRDGVVENINAITKTTDDSKYLIEQQELYNELLQQLTTELELSNQNDFVHPNSVPDDDVIDDGRVVGEFIISESNIFRNIGMDLFVPMETSQCIDFLKERLITMEETKFILENKLNNLVRHLKISYSILDSDLKDLADACIVHNDLKKMFNEDILIEKNLNTGDLMPAGIVTGDEDYVFNDEFGMDDHDSSGIMEIVEELDVNGNTVVSKVVQANETAKPKHSENKQGKNYKKNKKKRDRMKAKKQKLKEEQLALDAQIKEVKDMNESANNQKEVASEDSSEKEHNDPSPDIPIIKEVDLKDIKILGPRKNLETGNVEVPEYLKHTDPSKPAIAKEDLLDMNDLVAALEDMEVVEEEPMEEDNDEVVCDVTESDMILQDIHYDYDKLNKYLVEEDVEINLNFDDEELYDESEFDVSKMIAESKTDDLSNRFEKFIIDYKQPKPLLNAGLKPILKKIIGPTVIDSNKETKKSVSFANTLQIKEFESHKLFNRKNTFSNMAYYMYLDQSIEIEMDEDTITNTNKNKIINEDGDEEEELKTESLDIDEVDDILSDTVKKLTGEDTVAINDIIEKEVPEAVEEIVTSKKKMSRFKKESRREKRNSLMFTESSEFNVFANEENQNVVEEFVIEKDVILEHSDSNTHAEDEEEADESFNTQYQRSLEKTDSYFTEEELDEGREYAQNIYLEQEEDYDEDEEEDLGPVDEDEYEAQKQNNEEKRKEEDDLQEILNKPYEFPEELIKAINEDKDIEVIQEPKVDYSQFRTTEEMAEAYNLGLYDDDKDEFSNKNYQRVEGMSIDYTDDSHKGYIIEHMEDFNGYNEQVEILKDDIAEFIHDTQNLEKHADLSENEGDEVMVDIVEHEVEFTNEDEDDVNYFHMNDLNDDYRLDTDVLREDITKEYQRLKQKIIKMQKSEELEKLKSQEEAVNDVLEKEDPRQFEPLDEVGNPIKKSRFKQQRIKMNIRS